MTTRSQQGGLRAALTFLCLMSSGAFAQMASQLTPASVRPKPLAVQGEVSIPELSGPEAPKGADRLKVRLAGVTIDGGADKADAGDAIAAAHAEFNASIANKTVTVAEIFAAARRLEAAYGRAGFVPLASMAGAITRAAPGSPHPVR